MNKTNPKSLLVVFPNQLFEELPEPFESVALVEEELFFTQLHFHKQKLVLHRASMQYYQTYLQQSQVQVQYIASEGKSISITDLIAYWAKQNCTQLAFYEPDDDWLKTRITQAASQFKIQLVWYENPQFLLSLKQVEAYFTNKKSFLQANFYIAQRKYFNLLMEANQPLGGKWSFDEDNRKRFPKNQALPALPQCISVDDAAFISSAEQYVQTHFPEALGQLKGNFNYPVSHKGAQLWLKDFIEKRFEQFGTYEDAMLINAPLLHHSLLSVFLNNGLIGPKVVLEAVILAAQTQNIALNQTEGFVRQLVGWREFIRGIYFSKGRQQRTSNYWQFTREMPSSFYSGNSGLLPFDNVVQKVLKNGYCHHIERLMVLSNLMLLCEIKPNAVYTWFMELFIDAFDWVMVPNVYGMGQFADGGVMSTKPYICGSNYLLKMGDFEKGTWTQTWDALYWRFVLVHRDFFLRNPRMGMMVHSFDKMPAEKKNNLLELASDFLKQLDTQHA